MNQRVYITTLAGRPSFLVHELVGDALIADTVTDRYGLQESGEPHEWEAVNVDDEVKEVSRTAEVY